MKKVVLSLLLCCALQAEESALQRLPQQKGNDNDQGHEMVDQTRYGTFNQPGRRAPYGHFNVERYEQDYKDVDLEKSSIGQINDFIDGSLGLFKQTRKKGLPSCIRDFDLSNVADKAKWYGFGKYSDQNKYRRLILARKIKEVCDGFC